MKILVAGWDSGGGVEAVQTVVRRAVQRGHQVRVLGTEGLRARFESAGAGFRAYRYAPDNDCRRPETDLVKGWEARTPLARERDEDLVVDELERVAARPPEDVSGAAQRALLQHSRLLAGRAPAGARPAW